MAVLKDHRFAATAEWLHGKHGLIRARDKLPIDVAVPTELGGLDDDVWSPEELLLAACASSYELTIFAVAKKCDIPIHWLEVRSAGHVTRRDDGRLGFIAIELDVEFVTSSERVPDAEAAARRAKDVCIVTTALDVPVHLRVTARARDAKPEQVGIR